MTITIEQIDELRKRTNCSYEEAKEFLEKHNGNIIEAIVELEKKQRTNTSTNTEGNLWSKFKRLLRKGFETRFVILNKGETIINLSVNFMILVGIFAFHILLFGLVIALFLGYNFKIMRDKEKCVDVDKFFSEVSSKVKAAASNISDEKQTKTEQKSESDYNEVTIE